MENSHFYLKFKKFLLFGLPLLLVILVVSMLIYEKRIDKGWTSYQVDHSGVNWKGSRIEIESSGNVWVSTDRGLNVFDGEEWKTYTETNSGLSSDNIEDIKLDPFGKLWIQSPIGTFDGEVWDYSPYEALREAMDENGVFIPERPITIELDPSGKLWLYALNVVGIFDGKNWKIYTEENSNLPDGITKIAFDASGNAWAGSYNGVGFFDDESWYEYTTLNSGLPSDEIYHVAVDLSGTVWFGASWIGGLFGTGDQVVTNFDGETWTTFTTENSGLKNNEIRGINVDPKGNVWIECRDGLSVFSGTEWVTYTKQNSGLPDNIIYDIDFDPSGNVWITTPGGVGVFDGKDWLTYTTDNSGLPGGYLDDVDFDPSGDVWFVDGGKIGVLDNGINGVKPIPALEVHLRNLFISPESIFYSIIFIGIFWLAIRTDNFLALSGIAGWLMSLLLLGNLEWPMIASPLIIVPFFGSIGALVAKKIRNKKGAALLGMIIGIVIGIPIWGIAFLWFVFLPGFF